MKSLFFLKILGFSATFLFFSIGAKYIPIEKFGLLMTLLALSVPLTFLFSSGLPLTANTMISQNKIHFKLFYFKSLKLICFSCLLFYLVLFIFLATLLAIFLAYYFPGSLLTFWASLVRIFLATFGRITSLETSLLSRSFKTTFFKANFTNIKLRLIWHFNATTWASRDNLIRKQGIEFFNCLSFVF